MSRSAIVGRGRLLTMTGVRVGQTEAIEGAWVVVIADGRIAEVRAGSLRAGDPDETTEVEDALVTPGLVDPHTHLCFAGDRADEAAARSRGDVYTGGGILRTVRSTTDARRCDARGADAVSPRARRGLGHDDDRGEVRLWAIGGAGGAPAAPHR